jgi:hypothetical protein
MTYTNGAGEEYDGGIWDIKDSEKIVSFKLIEEPFYGSLCPKNMKLNKLKNTHHPLRVWEDGSYTVYPFQSGVPCYF